MMLSCLDGSFQDTFNSFVWLPSSLKPDLHKSGLHPSTNLFNYKNSNMQYTLQPYSKEPTQPLLSLAIYHNTLLLYKYNLEQNWYVGNGMQ